MKPANFPGRKNIRRISALARMAKPKPDLSLYAFSQTAYARLQARIVPDTVARGIRTKKDRSSRARVRA